MKKRFLLQIGLMLLALPIFAQDSLRIDFNKQGDINSTTEPGWEVIDTTDRDYFPVYRSFSKFSSTVKVKVEALPKPGENNHRVIARPGNFYSGSHEDLLDDWFAADILAGTSDSTHSIAVKVTGLPAGMYAWKSYHHDDEDQRSDFTAKIENKAGTIVDDATVYPITQSRWSAEPNYVTAFEEIGMFKYPQVVSAGTDDTITVTFKSIYSYRDDTLVVHNNQSLKLLLINGFELTESSSAAYLTGLSVKGGYSLSPAFDQNTIAYNVELSYDADPADIPGVMYTAGEEGTVDTTRAATLPGSTTVVVTSQDGTADKTYTINFTKAAAPSDDSTLVDLAVAGFDLVPAFSSDVFTYSVELPYGTTIGELPVVTYTAAPGATHSKTDATVLPGATTIKVKAENGVDSSLYTINFTLGEASSDPLMIDFNKTGSETEAGWEAIEASDKVVYPDVYSSFRKLSSRVYVKPIWLDKPQKDNHRAVDRDLSTYSDSLYDVLDDYIAADMIAGTNDTTTSIGVKITGLPAGKYAWKSYHHDTKDQRSEFTAKIENKAGIIVEDATKYQITQSEDAASPGFDTIFENVGTYHFGQVVSAGTDDTITVTFTSIYAYDADTANTNQSLKFVLINGFELKVASPDAYLTSLSLEGDVAIDPAFDKATFSYGAELPYGTTVEEIPDVIYTAVAGATVEVTKAAALPGATTLAVTSEDGDSTATYTIDFTLGEEPPALDTNATLTALSVAGYDLDPAFSSDVLEYDVLLPFSSTVGDIPDVTYTTAAKASAVVTKASALPGATTILVTAEDTTYKQTYTVNFAKDETPVHFTNENPVGLYPNPAIDIVSVEMPGKNINGKVYIYNILGGLEIEQDLSGAITNIDVSELSNSTYLVKIVYDDNKVAIKKLVKE